MSRSSTVAGLVLAAIACAMLGPPIPAAAVEVSGSYQVPLTAPFAFAPSNDTDMRIIETKLTLRAGETRRISDRLELTLSTDEYAEIENNIVCFNPVTNVQQGVAENSGINHPGSTAGVVALQANLLFTAPFAGTFTCQLRAQTSDGDRVDYHATAVPGSFPGGTWLQISSADEVGAHWWANPTCNTVGDPPCRFLGAPGDPTSMYVFQDDGSPHYEWVAPDNAVEADVRATMEITSCTEGTRSCPSNHKNPSIFGQEHVAVVRSHLEFIQLDQAGSFCKVNSTPDTEYSVANETHHYVINQYMHPQVSSTCGSRHFLLRIALKWVSGNPVKIDSGSFPDSYRSLTNAIATAGVRNTTTTVPNVLGAGEAAAISAVQGRGLTVGTVQHFLNVAPAGTVYYQNATAGTVEPEGSPVNLVVSLGSGTVPNVLSASRAAATSTLQAAGFAVAVTQVNGCLDPGQVSNEVPAAGTSAQPGSTVTITVPVCSGGGGGGGGGGGPIKPF